MRRPPIRQLKLSGSPTAMGAAHGQAHAEEIRSYASHRVDLVAQGRWSGGSMRRDEVLDLAAQCLPAHEAFSPSLHDEMLAMADTAQITPAEAIIVGGFTDFVDSVRAAVGGAVPKNLMEDDCTAFIVPDGCAEGAGLLGQTWDMHDTATEHVVLLHIHPDDGPAAVVFTTVGCLGQIGMNEVGVCVGVTNLSANDGRIGVTWPSVVREMLASETATDALAVLLSADLSGGHNYLIFDSSGHGYNVEAMPSARPVWPLADTPIVHTNHAIDPEAAAVEAPRDEDALACSRRRLELAAMMLADDSQPVDVETLMSVTREPTSICRVVGGPQAIETSGAAIMRPRTGDFWACWGLPSHNEYEKQVLAPTAAVAV